MEAMPPSPRKKMIDAMMAKGVSSVVSTAMLIIGSEFAAFLTVA